MDDKERFAFYEKVFYQELDRKEKLYARLSMPLAMLVAIVTFLSYMLNKAPTTEDGTASVFFWIFYLSTCVMLLIGALYFRAAWSLRDSDRGLPTLMELETHRRSFRDDYEKYWDTPEEADAHFKSLVLNYFIEGATVNTENNDKRGIYLRSLANYVTAALFVSVLSFLPFYIHQQEQANNDPKTTTTASTADALRKR
ncbi:hypothetical protein PSH97_21730 [Pseudomonas cucumis]|uniref:SMODS and SLOG-associating 2TM effector domain-containing protein n=1 Tax=Pseudomonas cucumis TaxID=2954082 RepID=A0ABY9EVD3_9PSED|nr:hypothetical protein [Pseudomonas cucumis]WLG83697.1 hypothetical protein PSH97_21730 [Pseudomonas cucumis]